MIELLVSVLLASIIFAAMVPMFAGAQQRAVGDQVRNTALNLAQDHIEKIRQMPFDQIVSGTNLDQAGHHVGLLRSVEQTVPHRTHGGSQRQQSHKLLHSDGQTYLLTLVYSWQPNTETQSVQLKANTTVQFKNLKWN
jgi:type II secretory pathway pseudopilin PulG